MNQHHKTFLRISIAKIQILKCYVCWQEERSYFWKKVMFAAIMSATAGLIFFFIKHRFFCEPGGQCSAPPLPASSVVQTQRGFLAFPGRGWLILMLLDVASSLPCFSLRRLTNLMLLDAGSSLPCFPLRRLTNIDTDRCRFSPSHLLRPKENSFLYIVEADGCG